MKKNILIEKPIYLIVPGFIGNYQEGFIGRLYEYLIKNKHKAYGIRFKGHRKNEKTLANPDEMVKHLKNEYQKIKKKNPSKKIIILAHSQGCAVTLKSHHVFGKKARLVLIAPAVFIDEIILPRIDKETIELIKSDQVVNCRVAQNKFRLIDKKWIRSYEKFSLENSLPKIKQDCLIIRPTDDFIDKKNSAVLARKIPRNTYIEILGNHWFDEPKKSFDGLVDKIF